MIENKHQSHFLLENRVVLRVGTVINRRFNNDLVRVGGWIIIRGECTK